jgi:hypothetical protein
VAEVEAFGVLARGKYSVECKEYPIVNTVNKNNTYYKAFTQHLQSSIGTITFRKQYKT